MVVHRISILMVYFLAIAFLHPSSLDHEPTGLVSVRSVSNLLGLSVVLTVFLLVVSGFFAGHDSPSLAGPVSGLGLWTGVLAVMTGSEALPAGGDVLLDRHVGISKADDLGLVSILDADS